MTENIPSLAGRIGLITGASRGIGRATAHALCGAGMHGILTARTEGGLTEVEATIHENGGTATLAPLDLTQDGGIEALAQAVANRWGRLDVLILNAAKLGALSPVSHISPKLWAEVFALNLAANHRLLAAFDPLLRASPHGRVIALTSSVATQPRGYWSAYAASKAGLESLLDCYADEVARITPVRVAILDPGGTATAMRAEAFPGEDPAKLNSPEAVAQTLLHALREDFPTGARLKTLSR